jgi:preprotein translocase subunit SecA
MLKGLFDKVVGDSNEREIRKLQPLVDRINAIEADMERRSDADLRALTDRFRARLASGETLDDLLVDAFAAVREVAKRTVDMRPFDVQLVGGIVLHQGKVAEMKTGEGKTLVATMPVYLNALLGQGVHLVTVNDYLARRDTLWMGPVYHLLGLSVGLLQSGADQPAYLYDPGYQRDPYPGLRPVPRGEAYDADITYGTNNEFGFDYLRDNLALSLERRVQRPLYYAIVDEVDNIFIDEARTPLIISGPSNEPVEEYSSFATIARKLEMGVHYELEDKERSVFLTDEGLALVEQETGIENIYDEANYRYVHYMQQALKAQVLFLEGRDYIRQRQQIILIDQHTGRLMPNRRLSEGLHQAIEAKEGVPVQPRDVTSATITIQNYFRMYQKLAGMSGTAVTETEEFFKIYGLDVVAIPTNKPVIRQDHADVVYRSEEAKLRAVAREILSCHSSGQPVLVGTTSVEMSERLSKRLTGDRLQMAAIAPRLAYALQDAEFEREKRSSLREIMNGSLETMNSAAWRRMARDLGVEANALNAENLDWIAEYLELPSDPGTRRALERALREGIPHEVLNAKEHTREAAIIARAGEPGAVTIATNMAGRGVDIKLGGELSDEVIHKAHQALETRGLDPFTATPAQMDSAIAEVTPQYAQRRERALEAGGLHVLGTERHEARRIDNQLRGRSGRQGEPGSSRFYLSLEDDLMRRFGRKEMLAKLMEQIGDDFPIEHGLVSKTIERAQTSVEGHNFDIRKHLLEYDDVLNRQRETIYDERLQILKSDDLRSEVWRMLERQVDEYLEKYSEGGDQQRLLFAGLDDVVPLVVPAPNAPFQGPLRFAGHLSAFPPFTIGFLADRLSGQDLEQVRQSLRELAQEAADGYGEQLRHTITEIAQNISSTYDERLERYQLLLDEKIDDYLQLLEERGQQLDLRRLVQHLGRTYPLSLSMPSGNELSSMDSLEDVREHWRAEVEIDYHRQTSAGFIERVLSRLPGEAVGGLDRFRASRIPSAKLAEELQRVKELATKQPRSAETRRQIEQLNPPGDDPARVLAFVSNIKSGSNIDFGRLDRLMGHVVGAYLDDLIQEYMEAASQEDGLLQRDLERLQASVVEGKKGGRANNLLEVLRQLADIVHLDISTLEEVLGHAVAHEYDKWAQRQLSEIETNARRNPLTDNAWSAIAEHLLTTYYAEVQAYDRGHRRQTTWMPRLPLSYAAHALVDASDPAEVRAAVLDSLSWALDQREQAWGQQEMRRWQKLSLQNLDQAAYDGLTRYLGARQLGSALQQSVADLPADLYNRLRFILAWRELEKHDPRLSNLPHAQALLEHMADVLEGEILDTAIHDLDSELRDTVVSQLRSSGFLDDPAAKAGVLERPIEDWKPETHREVSRFLGRQFIQAHQTEPIGELPEGARNTTIAYLERRRYFVDEAQIQQFLVRQRLSDLPAEIQGQALERLAQTRLERMNRRKISNLDVDTRQVVVSSAQRLGLFTDKARQQAFGEHVLGQLEPKVRDDFARFLGREHLNHRRLSDLNSEARRFVLDRLQQQGLLTDPVREQDMESQRLAELDGDVSIRVRESLVRQLREDLATKTMEELPQALRRRIHQVLNEQDYFVDPERVRWYERQTLAQLPSDLLRGLEMYLGHTQLAELASMSFRDLPAAIQQSLSELFDAEGLFRDRAERLRITQTGTLADLPEEARERVAQHLGRDWLVSIRDRRPPNLPEKERSLVWAFVRDQDYLADEFKEELFAYQRLEEFSPEAQHTVEDRLVERLEGTLASTPVGELSPELQAEVESQLWQAGYFVDQERLKQVEESPLTGLPSELEHAVLEALGAYLLQNSTGPGTYGSGPESVPVTELPDEIRSLLWRYLDEIGYFVEEKKQNQFLESRLVDLEDEVYQTIVQDLVAHLRTEIGDQPVADLGEELRQGLREAIEDLGYFESQTVRAGVLGQPLSSVRRDDQDALAVELGGQRLKAGSLQRLSDLPAGEQQAVMSHLQSRDWFLDQGRYDQVLARRLGDLERDLLRDLVPALRRQYLARIEGRRLSRLARDQRQIIRDFLRQRGLAAEESELRPLRQRALQDLEKEVYHDLLRDLGSEAIAGWDDVSFQELSPEQQGELVAYLGRRIMGQIERRVLLYTISRLWIDYLTDIEDLRRGIGLEAYGQRDPLVEYKRRAFELFAELGDNIRRTVVRSIFRQPPEPLAAP